jgi:hypothetical protein
VNTDFDFGTGDFSASGWVKAGYVNNGSGWNYIIGNGSASSTGSSGWNLSTSSTRFCFQIHGGGHRIYSNDWSAGVWYHLVASRLAGNTYIYLNGALQSSGSSTHNVSSHTLKEIYVGAENPNVQVTRYLAAGSLALWRISATAPTAEQIKEIYEAEKPMFQENAKCTLNGTSDAVTAMSYDDSNEELLVGTSGGLSVFKGLRRVDENTNNITEVAQQGGLRVEEY